MAKALLKAVAGGGRQPAVWGLAGVLCIGLILRFWNFPSLSLTYDELGSGAFNAKAPDLITYQCLINMHFPEQLPLYCGLEYIWLHWFGFSVTSLRLLPLTLSVLTLPLPYFLAARFYGRTAGMVALLCYALSPLNIWWAQGSRASTVLAPMGTIFLYSLIRYREAGSWKWGGVHLASVMVMLWLTLTSLFLVAAECCFLLLYVRGRLLQTLYWGMAVSAAALPTLIWVHIMPHYGSQGAGNPSPFFLIGALVCNDSMHLNADIPRPKVDLHWGSLDAWLNWGLAACFAAAIAGLLISVVRRWLPQKGEAEASGRKLPQERNVLLLLVILLPPLFAFGTALLFKRNLLFARYTMYSWPALYAVMGGCIAWLPRRWLRTVAVLVLAGLYAYQIPLLMPTTRRADWLGAGEYIRSRATSQDVVFATGEYLSGEVFDTNMRWSGKPLGIPVLTAATVQAAVEGALWYLAHGNPDRPPRSDRAAWILLQGGECPDPYGDLNSALSALGFAYTCYPLVAGDTIIIHRITLNEAAAVPPGRADAPLLVDLPEPNPYSRVDWNSFLDAGGVTDDSRNLYGEILRRSATHMYYDPLDLTVWTVNLLASRQRELALMAADGCLKMMPDYSLGHLARGLTLKDMGRDSQARAEIDRAFAHNSFLRRVYASFISAFFDGGGKEAVRAEIQKLEEMGLIWFTPALWTLYRNRFEPSVHALPVGISAPSEKYYQAWMGYFGNSPRQMAPLNARATAQLALVSSLMRAAGE